MNSFGFSLDQGKSFPHRIGSVPQQDQCFPWACCPRDNPSPLGNKIPWSHENPHNFMGPPAFFPAHYIRVTVTINILSGITNLSISKLPFYHIINS